MWPLNLTELVPSKAAARVIKDRSIDNQLSKQEGVDQVEIKVAIGGRKDPPQLQLQLACQHGPP